MKNFYIAILLSLVVTTSAFADNSGKAYIAADIGRASYIPATIYNDPLMYYVAGGYHFSKRWAAEIGYAKLNNSTTCTLFKCDTFSVSSTQIAVIFSQPLTEQLDLIVKLGQANHSVNESGTGPSAYSNTVSKSSVMYGIGAQYHVSSKVSVRAQYSDYGDLVSTSPTTKATSLTAGVIYNF